MTTATVASSRRYDILITQKSSFLNQGRLKIQGQKKMHNQKLIIIIQLMGKKNLNVCVFTIQGALPSNCRSISLDQSGRLIPPETLQNTGTQILQKRITADRLHIQQLPDSLLSCRSFRLCIVNSRSAKLNEPSLALLLGGLIKAGSQIEY